MRNRTLLAVNARVGGIVDIRSPDREVVEIHVCL